MTNSGRIAQPNSGRSIEGPVSHKTALSNPSSYNSSHPFERGELSTPPGSIPSACSHTLDRDYWSGRPREYFGKGRYRPSRGKRRGTPAPNGADYPDNSERSPPMASSASSPSAPNYYLGQRAQTVTCFVCEEPAVMLTSTDCGHVGCNEVRF